MVGLAFGGAHLNHGQVAVAPAKDDAAVIHGGPRKRRSFRRIGSGSLALLLDKIDRFARGNQSSRSSVPRESLARRRSRTKHCELRLPARRQDSTCGTRRSTTARVIGPLAAAILASCAGQRRRAFVSRRPTEGATIRIKASISEAKCAISGVSQTKLLLPARTANTASYDGVRPGHRSVVPSRPIHSEETGPGFEPAT